MFPKLYAKTLSPLWVLVAGPPAVYAFMRLVLAVYRVVGSDYERHDYRPAPAVWLAMLALRIYMGDQPGSRLASRARHICRHSRGARVGLLARAQTGAIETD